MSDAAWGALGALIVALFGAGGYLQYRRDRNQGAQIAPVAENAKEAKAGIDTLLPIVADLQKRLEDNEDAMMELMILLAAHNEWDMRVLIEIRKHLPDFPDPPPLKRKGDHEA